MAFIYVEKVCQMDENGLRLFTASTIHPDINKMTFSSR